MKSWFAILALCIVSLSHHVHCATAVQSRNAVAITERTAVLETKKKPGVMKRGYDWYLYKCIHNPIATKSITAAVIASTGDLIAQKLEAHLAKTSFELNRIRITTFFLCGLTYVGPFIHKYYDLLANLGARLQKKYDLTNLQQTLAQLFVDQTLGVAIFFPLYFYAYEYLESFVRWTPPSLQRANTKMLAQIKDVVLMQYRVYPLANGINFGLVPRELRVLFSNAVSVFWNIYLCSILG
jgi:protein Mpv17